MTLSFSNLPSVIAAETKKLMEKAPNEAGVHCWLGGDHQVHVVMKRVLAYHGVPRETQSSAYKAVKDTATVTITPPNEELTDIITKYFLSEKISASMGAPERFFFDVVIINEKTIIG